MYTIKFLTNQKPMANEHLDYLKEQGWNATSVEIDELLSTEEEISAIVIKEESMQKTCSWLMKLTEKIAVPIYILSTNGDSETNVVYLKLGVKICFSVDINTEELFHTLKNLLYNEHEEPLKVERKDKKLAGLKLIPSNLSVLINGEKEIILTRKEFQAMEILHNSPSKAIPYAEFRATLWECGSDVENENYRIANIIFHLRTKIEENAAKPRFIKTIHTKGYMLDLN